MTQLQAKDITDTTQLIDVRTADEFLREHIAGSRNIPLDQVGTKAAELAGQKIVLTCRSGRRAEEARQILASAGCNELCLLEGGLIGWKAAGQPTVSLKKGISIMRQVQIIVGCMILTGFFFKPLWFLAPLAGIGMLTAGLTDTCMMAIVLGKMPWNRQPGGEEVKNCSI